MIHISEYTKCDFSPKGFKICGFFYTIYYSILQIWSLLVWNIIGNQNAATLYHKRAICIQGYMVHSAILLLLGLGTLNYWIGPRLNIKDNFEAGFP